MPVFEKDDRRVYFAHIPKAAGTSVYVLFARNNWKIANLALNPKNGIGKLLLAEFNIHQLQIEGNLENLKTSIQHASEDIWNHWGPFHSSFAISRHPEARYLSAVKFRYNLVPNRTESFEDFREALLSKLLNRYHRKNEIFDGHFRPQHMYIQENSKIFSA